MLADSLLVGHHSDSRDFWDRPQVVTSFLIQGYDNRGLVLLCVLCFLFYESVSIFWSILVYFAAPNCHKDSRFNSIKNGLYQDWRRHPRPSGYYTNQLQVSCGAKFKFLLNVNMNIFIIEHTTDTKIPLPVPLDHRNIFQVHWANLKAADLAFENAKNIGNFTTLLKPCYSVTHLQVILLFFKSFHFWVSYITFWNVLKIPSVFKGM
jgi:hypothetical protein